MLNLFLVSSTVKMEKSKIMYVKCTSPPPGSHQARNQEYLKGFCSCALKSKLALLKEGTRNK